jgi:Family of unknown function (DUF6049)
VLSAGRRVVALTLVLGSAVCSSASAVGDPAQQARTTVVAHRASTANPLKVTIDGVHPLNLARGGKVRITGTVTNTQLTPWAQVQVFLNIDSTPIRDDRPFDAIVDAGANSGFGTGPFGPGLYDQIRRLPARQTRRFSLTIPQSALGAHSGNGVYHLGIRVLGTSVLGRDSITDGRADTFVPSMRRAAARRTSDVLLMVPVTAPVLRWADGSFMDDSLGRLFEPGGRLDNLLTLLSHAPPDNVEVALDPALVEAAAAMRRGYRVTSLSDHTHHRSGRNGKLAGHIGGHQEDAAAWLDMLFRVVSRQNLVLLPYADPDTTTLTSAGLRGILRATVRQARQVARDNSWTASVAAWTSDGLLPRHAATALRRTGAAPLVLSDAVLPTLGRPPPAVITYHSADGWRTSVVVRSRLASVRVRPTVTPLALGQALLAEATVAALGPPAGRIVVTATDFEWNPGPDARAGQVFRAFRASWVSPTTLADVQNRRAERYNAKIAPASPLPSGLGGLHLAELSAYFPDARTFAALVGTSRTYGDTRRNLAIAGSDQWRHNVGLGEKLARVDAAAAAARLNRVSISGPSLVALSSSSGRFPLTVTNRLAVPITVSIQAVSTTHALDLRPVPQLKLQANQRRDIEMFGSARGSTVSSVQVRLATVRGHRFGQQWQFNVRTTQFGLLIWIVMAVGFAILVGTAGLRVVRRVRRGYPARGGSRPT